MRQLSSSLTDLNKYWYPVAVLTSLVILILVNLKDPAAQYVTHPGLNPELMPLIIFIPVMAFVYAYGMRVKTVVLDGSELVITGYLHTIRVPLSDVEQVKSNLLKMPEIITIRFRERTRFGKKIVFLPPWRVMLGLSPHPLVKELQARVRVAKDSA